MDKKTYMILLVGFIFVILLSNNNSLEALTCNQLQRKITGNIKNIKYNLRHNNKSLKKLKNIDNKTTSLMKHGRRVNKCYNKYIGVNNQTTRQLLQKGAHLQGSEAIASKYLNNIDLSLEKVNDSQLMYDKYSFDSVVWGIVTVGLLITTLTIIM